MAMNRVVPATVHAVTYYNWTSCLPAKINIWSCIFLYPRRSTQSGLVVCAQALFACISLHNGRLNQTNNLHRSRSSNENFSLGYNYKGPHLCALLCCLVTSLSRNDVLNEQFFSKHAYRHVKREIITKKVNHFGTPFEMRIVSGTYVKLKVIGIIWGNDPPSSQRS